MKLETGRMIFKVLFCDYEVRAADADESSEAGCSCVIVEARLCMCDTTVCFRNRPVFLIVNVCIRWSERAES